MKDIDLRILAAAMAQPQNQQQWNPVLGFLIPLYGQLVVSEGVATSEASAAASAADAWQQALAAFRQIGFQFIPPLGCKVIDNESANELALNRGLDEAGRDAR